MWQITKAPIVWSYEFLRSGRKTVDIEQSNNHLKPCSACVDFCGRLRRRTRSRTQVHTSAEPIPSSGFQLGWPEGMQKQVQAALLLEIESLHPVRILPRRSPRLWSTTQNMHGRHSIDRSCLKRLGPSQMPIPSLARPGRQREPAHLSRLRLRVRPADRSNASHNARSSTAASPLRSVQWLLVVVAWGLLWRPNQGECGSARHVLRPSVEFLHHHPGKSTGNVRPAEALGSVLVKLARACWFEVLLWGWAATRKKDPVGVLPQQSVQCTRFRPNLQTWRTQFHQKMLAPWIKANDYANKLIRNVYYFVDQEKI